MKFKLLQLNKLLKSYLANLMISKDPIKFVIFSQGRTGSTLLCKLLDNQNSIHCEGEILSRHKNFMSLKLRFPYAFISGRSKLSHKSAFGFKVKTYQISEHLELNPEVFLQTLANKGYKIIYLRRNNVLAQAASTLSANKTGVYHLTAGQDETLGKIKVDKKTLEYYMQTRLDYIEDENLALSNLEILKLEYEYDLENSTSWENTVKKCCEFLDLPKIKNFKCNIKLRKTRKRTLSQSIEKYDELKQEFSNSKFSRYFN